MSVETISVILRAWLPGQEESPAAQFFDKLLFAPDDAPHKETGPGVPRVQLLSLAAADFAEANEPSEAFAAAQREGFAKAAQWLDKQPPATFQDLRKAGWSTDVFIGAWIDVDQMDLNLPTEFLQACGKHGLGVSLITND